MSPDPGNFWRFLLFLLLTTGPPALLLLLPAFRDGITGLEYTALLGAVALPSLLIYLRIRRELRRFAERMEQAATMSPLDVQATDGAGGGLLPVDNLLLAMEQYRRVLRHMLRETEMRQTETGLLFDLLPDPVLVLGRGRQINRSNAAAKRFFHASEMSGDLSRFIRHPALLKAVDLAADGGARESERIEFTVPDVVPRHVAGYIVSLKDKEERVGAELILTLHDLTEARRMQQMRVDFIANASHELRTPLAILTGALETLMGPARHDVAAHERFFTMMQTQTARMSQLVNDLLSLSQIEISEHTRPTEKVEMARLLGAVADLLRAKAAELDKRIRLEMPEGDVAIIGDFDQLTQVFTNLVDNALKYGREKSEVVIHLTRGRTEARVSVIDEGEGIGEEHIARLTERFYRVNDDRSRKLGGTGLGLAIVKHIVSRHRGHLEITSRPGEGSVFTVRLPVYGS